MELRKRNGDLIASGDNIKLIVENNKSNLRDADLSNANLYNAYLSHADLSHADLSNAYLSRADLSNADLIYADLSNANLSNANFENTKRGDWIINSTPIVMQGLSYEVIIFDEHMEIGCEHHSFNAWSEFTDEEIFSMDGNRAKEFWENHKLTLLTMCEFKAGKK